LLTVVEAWWGLIQAKPLEVKSKGTAAGRFSCLIADCC